MIKTKTVSIILHSFIDEIKRNMLLFLPVFLLLSCQPQNQTTVRYNDIANDLDQIPLGEAVCGFTSNKEIILYVNLLGVEELSKKPQSKDFKSLLAKILPNPESDAPVLAFVKLKDHIN